MIDYTVIGVSRLSGTSKKTGQPFEMTRLHLVYEDETDQTLEGSGCMMVTPFSTVFKASDYDPAVGDVINLFYEPGYDGKARISLISLVK